MLTMPAVSVLSDSQDSVLLDSSLMDHLQDDLQRDNIPMDFLTNGILDEPEKKYDMNLYVRQGDQQYCVPAIPAPTSVPARDEFPGNYDFQLMLNHQASSKNWIYSQSLAKVFIQMDEVLPLRFKWQPSIDGLYLRTRMSYVLEQHRSEPVFRCHNHKAMPSRANTGLDLAIINHVVRCVDRPSLYEELPGGHHSIRTPLGIPEIGAIYVPVHYKFQCKNSCTSGMNRRATELIFTLEDEQQNVLGRRRLLVRICSCPKRDKQKEEAEASGGTLLTKKRKGGKVDSANPGKRHCTAEDNTPHHLQFEIWGKEEAQALKKFAFDLMAGKAVRTGQLDFYKPCLDKLSAL